MVRTPLQNLGIALAAICGIGLIIVGLWAWQNAESVVAWMRLRQPEGGLSAVRCAAVGAVALAQAVLLWMVVGSFYRRDLASKILVLSALIVFMLSTAAAVALGLAGR